MSSQKKVQCSRFEPQTWRKTLCKNCFKTRNEHTEEATEEPRTPDAMSDGVTSPEVLSGEKIILRRRLVTPPRECQVGDFVSLGRRGSDSSSGRRTPVREDLTNNDNGRNTPITEVSEGKEREDQKSKEADFVDLAAKGTASDRNTPIREEQKGKVSERKGCKAFGKEADVIVLEAKGTDTISGRRTPVREEPKGQEAPTAGFRVGKVVEASVSLGAENAQSGASPREVEDHCPLHPIGHLVAQANKPTDSPTLTSVTRPSGGDQAKPTLVPLRSASRSPSPFSEATKAATVAEPSGKTPTREVNIDAAVVESGKNAAGKQMEEEMSSPGRNEGASINNRDFRTPEIGLESHAAQTPSVLGANSSPSGVQRQPSVQQRTSNECTPASLTLGPLDKGKAGEENKSASIGTSTNPTTSAISSSSNSGQAADAHTKIAPADAAVESGASSYGKSLRIHLSSPVNTEAAGGRGAAGEGGGVGCSPEETKNSYGIRHGSSSPATLAACSGPDFSAAPAKQDATSDSRFNAASAAVGVAQIDLAKSGELRSQEISPQNDGAPIELNASAERVVDSHPSGSSSASLSRAKVETSLSLGGVAPAPPANELVNNSSVGSTTSGYQYVDANDSRLSYSVIAEGGGGVGSRSPEGTFYYLTTGQEATGNPPSSSSEPSYPDQPRRKVTSLFHHVPGDSGGYPDEAQQSPNLQWTGSDADSPAFSSQADDETQPASYNSQGGVVCQPYQQPGSGRRRRRSRVISLDDANAAMSGFEYNRSDAMMEGTRIVMESLREKVAQMQDQCERLEREKGAIGDLLAAKKSDYELMKEHFSGTISNLELEVQRLKSEKSRLLDKLQLPESERASLAAEENEIAELKRRLEEYENRYTEVVGENEDLKQEVRDLQLEMEEMHDQFREEETMEFRELQKELENTAKNCRIIQFKLRKAERRNEQLESDRVQYDEKLRHYESCFQSSDDKRRIRVLEEDLRQARESAVRLHADLERAEERKLKHQEELDRAKNSVNEADNKRLCLQNELDSMKHEMIKLRDQLRFDGRQEVIKSSGIYKISVPETELTVAQLTKDLKDSLERENDLKEQLKFSEEENATMRKKLLEMEEETESMSLQLRKLSSAKSGRFTKVKPGDQGVDSEAAAATERESELRLQMELAEQEVKVLKRKMDELQQDNDNLLCAIKYLRSKLEQRDGARSATPIGDTKSTRDLLTRLGAAAAEEEAAGGNMIKQQLEGAQKEVLSLRERVKELEIEKSRLADEVQKLQATGVPAGQNGPTATPCVSGTAEEAIEKEKNLVKTIEELEQLLMQEKEKVLLVANEKQTFESNLQQEKSLLTQELADVRKDLTRSGEELKKMKTDLEMTEKEKEALKKDSAQHKEELKAANEMKTKLESLQKTHSVLQTEHDKLLKEKSKPVAGSATGATKDKEPASWRWEKQDLEKQVKEFKKKFEDLQAEMKKPQAKSKDDGSKVRDDSKEVAKLTEECESYRKQLEEMKKKLTEMEGNLKKAEKEKEKASKELKEAVEKAVAKEKAEAASKSKDLGTKFKDDSSSAEKKKLAKELEAEKKRNEELIKERDLMVKDKESWTSEKKKLVQEKDAAIKEKDELAAKTGNESEDTVKRSTPFGLRSKVGLGGKSTETADSAKIKELTETLEKKEAELKTLKAKVETKGHEEKLGIQAKELSDLRKENERLEQDLDESTAEKKTLKSDIQKLKEKLKSGEDTWNKERQRLEQDLKESSEKTKPLAKTSRGSDDSLKQEKEALVKEKLKLIEDVTKLKKDLGELDKKRTSEKEGFEKTLKEKTKALDETKATCEELEKEIEKLKVTGSKPTSSAASNVVTIPVQSDRSAKAIPIQKISSRSFNSSASSEDQDLPSTACLAAIEETYRSRTRTLEDELGGLREQLSSVQRDSETQAVKSQKAFAELKANFDKEFSAWNKERELHKKNGKLADEYGSKVTKLEKTLEELNGKLKVEEAKRRELEVKLLAQENAAKGDKTSTPTTEEKPKVLEDKKSQEFRNRFEKFGGTPRPVRKLSLPSSTSTTTSSSDSGEKGDDWVGGIQRQMTETEKARLKDREELLEKMERQKKDFELRLEAFKETTNMLDTKSQELSTLEKKMAEVHCQLEEEKSNWVKERSKLQSKLNDVQQKGREDKEKVAELTREIKKLQQLTSEKGATTSPSGTSTPLTPSTSLGAEKPGFRVKTPEVSASQSPQPISIVIPVRKVDNEKKTQSAGAEDGTASPVSAATSNGVGKLSKKLFPFATDSQTSSNSSAKPYTPGQRTPIPINRISRSNPPKV